MWIALIVGILFLGGRASNLFGSEPNFADASAGLGISAVLLGVFLFARAARLKDAELLQWVVTNAPEIRNGGARYGETLITPATVLTRYQAALSFLVVTFKIPSRYYIEGDSAPWPLPVSLTATTLALGWWGMPWGPIYTVQVLAKNVRGGIKESVGDLLEAVGSQDEDVA